MKGSLKKKSIVVNISLNNRTGHHQHEIDCTFNQQIKFLIYESIFH